MKNSQFVGSYKPGCNSIQTLDYTNVCFDMNVFLTKYVLKLDVMRNRVNQKLFPFYRKNLNFRDSIVGEVNFKIKQIESSTGRTTQEIAETIRNYVKEDLSFFVNDKPVSSDSIIEAFEGTQKAFPVDQIIKILNK